MNSIHPNQVQTKKCSTCRAIKNLDMFYNNRVSKDGKSGQCIDCIRNKQRAYKNSPEGRAVKKRYRSKPSTRLKRREYDKKWKRNNQQKVKSHGLVKHAVNIGIIPPVTSLTCYACNKEQASQYHHSDYSKPLNVVPLCTSCHKRLHMGDIKIDTSDFFMLDSHPLNMHRPTITKADTLLALATRIQELEKRNAELEQLLEQGLL